MSNTAVKCSTCGHEKARHTGLQRECLHLTWSDNGGERAISERCPCERFSLGPVAVVDIARVEAITAELQTIVDEMARHGTSVELGQLEFVVGMLGERVKAFKESCK